MLISILGADQKSNYFKIPGLDIWTKERDFRNFDGENPVICHAPCAQWSRCKGLAKESDEKELSLIAWKICQLNGGIFEHPSGSSFFKYAGIDRKDILSVDQSWFGFPAKKTTYLVFVNCKPLAFPISLDCPAKKVAELHSRARSLCTLSFCKWLVDSVRSSYLVYHSPH
jgi:hypothetical protein